MFKILKERTIILPFIPKENFSVLDLLFFNSNNSNNISIEFLVSKGEIFSSLVYNSNKIEFNKSSREIFRNSINLHIENKKVILLDQDELILDYKHLFDDHINNLTNNLAQTLIITGWDLNQAKLFDIDMINKLLTLLSQQNEFSALIQLSLTFDGDITKLSANYSNLYENDEKFIFNNKLLAFKDNLSPNYDKNVINFSLIISVVSIEDKNQLKSIIKVINNYLTLSGFKTKKYPSFFVENDQIAKIITKRSTKFNIEICYESLKSIFQFVNNQLPFWLKSKDYPDFLNNEVISSQSNKSIFIGSQIRSRSDSSKKIFLDLSSFSSHMNIWGMTGEGKSRVLYHLSAQLMEKNIKVMIIDLKGEYKYALGQSPNITYIRPGSNNYPFSINIFDVPGSLDREEDSQKHIDFTLNIIYRLLGEYELTSQMNFLLSKAIVYTIKNKGDFFHFMKVINNPRLYGINKNKIELSSEALNNRLNRIITGIMKKIFFVKNSNFSISQFANNNVIIDLEEFENLENDQGRKFFIEVLLNYFIYYFKENRLPIREKEEITNVIIFDEAQKIIPEKKRKEYSDEQSIIGKAVWTLRSYGVSMIFSGTEPAIEQSVRLNAGITLSFFTKYDAIIMSNILGLSMKDYLQARNLLENRYFLLSQKGKISLLKSPDFLINQFTTLDIDNQKSVTG